MADERTGERDSCDFGVLLPNVPFGERRSHGNGDTSGEIIRDWHLYQHMHCCTDTSLCELDTSRVPLLKDVT